MLASPTLGLSLIATLASAPAAARGSITVDAGRGPVTVHVPASYEVRAPAPLVILLHAWGGTGASQEAYMQFLPRSEEFGFLYAAPDGLVDLHGAQFWNATDACCDAFDSGVDDSTYLLELIAAVQAQLAVDPRRIHLIGHSNGGFMAYRFACDHPQVVASLASLAGATWLDPDDCAPSEPVHVLQIHGTEDMGILYGGGVLEAPYPGAVATVKQWAVFGNCSLAPDVSAPPLDLVPNLPDAETTVARYADACALNGSAELWTIGGGVHFPDLSANFSLEVVEFLFDHPKSGAGTSFCSSTPNSTGGAALIRGEGSDSIAQNDLRLVSEPVPPDQFGIFYYGPEELELPFGNGLRCVGAGALETFRLPVQQSSAGEVLAFDVDYGGTPAGGELLAGSTWKFQGWFRDPAAGGAAFDLSDGLSIAFRP